MALYESTAEIQLCYISYLGLHLQLNLRRGRKDRPATTVSCFSSAVRGHEGSPHVQTSDD